MPLKHGRQKKWKPAAGEKKEKTAAAAAKRKICRPVAVTRNKHAKEAVPFGERLLCGYAEIDKDMKKDQPEADLGSC